MKNLNKELLHRILHIESESYNTKAMMDFLLAYAKEKGYDHFFDTPTGNFYMTKGRAKTYPCIVAHTDTVHKITGHGISLVTFGNCITGFDGTTMRQTGIGGDDKCGIYAALHCLEHLPACKAAFFVDEEVGCKGSKHCYMKFFRDCRFVLQADRRGNDDFVTDIFGQLSSHKFQADVLPIITQYGYEFSTGAMTDVEALRDNKINLSVANMSAGYYRPHSDFEYIDMMDLDNVCTMMVDIASTMTKTYRFTYEPPKYKYGKVTHFSGKGEFGQFGHSSFREEFPDWKPGSTWINGRFVTPEEEEEINHLAASGFLTAEEAAELIAEEKEYEKKMLALEYEKSVIGAD